MSGQEYLTGGGVNEVVRIGESVRRPAGPWTPQVHALLRHIRERGFTGAPAVYGIDSDGREELSFLSGEVSNYPLTEQAASTAALTSAARLLRRYHDATVDFRATYPDGWQLPSQSPAEVVCHGDFAPYNCVLDGTAAVGIIDFDTAHPGPRLWDVAYSVYRWAPLTAPENRDGFGSPAQQARRARLFCDAYGLTREARTGLPAMVVARLGALVDFMTARAADGDEAFQSHLAGGHHLLYSRDMEHVRENADLIGEALLAP